MEALAVLRQRIGIEGIPRGTRLCFEPMRSSVERCVENLPGLDDDREWWRIGFLSCSAVIGGIGGEK